MGRSGFLLSLLGAVLAVAPALPASLRRPLPALHPRGRCAWQRRGAPEARGPGARQTDRVTPAALAATARATGRGPPALGPHRAARPGALRAGPRRRRHRRRGLAGLLVVPGRARGGRLELVERLVEAGGDPLHIGQRVVV